MAPKAKFLAPKAEFLAPKVEYIAAKAEYMAPTFEYLAPKAEIKEINKPGSKIRNANTLISHFGGNVKQINNSNYQFQFLNIHIQAILQIKGVFIRENNILYLRK